ncbi:GCN5 family acetyltransferase [Flavobacterium akiainvivens]|uniref:GCN5 family acetyltransferase n=1 Tax=Flavobacterium akiainvivens TaxID=1202724 RepID=A0A0M9VID0_9FLAO|nr:GNAT family N-acetyltransferase [Flavobacterium akiainvivens]KOS06546.1 GCN5 family acetyltransferase [Flavobacterium akiainvivens]SFQ10856.1 Acetyltransferase (GNAT) family protein [Flavobacterium akiainvivens]
MTQPNFKPFAPLDAPAVITMMQDFYAIDGYPMDAAVNKGLFFEFVEKPDLGKGWVIVVDGQPVGYVILTFVFSFEYAGRIAFLDELFITAEMRGRGLAKQALDFIAQEAASLSVKIIYLEIEPHNETAKKLYLSKGFTEHKRGLLRWQFSDGSFSDSR